MSDTGFVEWCLELLAGDGNEPPRARRMFGAHGLYVGDLFVAIGSAQTLFLKTDESTQAQFEAAGSRPFSYEKAGGVVMLTSYWSAPDEAMDSPAAMAPWLRLARASALRAAAAKAAAPKHKPRASKSQAAAKPSSRRRA